MGQSWAYEGRRERPSYPWRGGRKDCCGECGGPPERCRCHECRREAKFLLVEDAGKLGNIGRVLGGLKGFINEAAAPESGVEAAAADTAGKGSGYIGGDCCVSLSVEVAASAPTIAFTAAVFVQDTEGDTLAWEKAEPAGTRYKVHEHVITTRPGAKLLVLAKNCTVRVRWCECFSC